MKDSIRFSAGKAFHSFSGVQGRSSQAPVPFHNDTAARRIKPSIGGRPFTAGGYSDTLAKPILFPLRAANGDLVTRGGSPSPFFFSGNSHQRRGIPSATKRDRCAQEFAAQAQNLNNQVNFLPPSVE